MVRGALKLATGAIGLALAVVLVIGLASPGFALAAARPVVTHVSPAHGSTLGGNTVNIRGRHFTAHGHSLVRKVIFGKRAATKVKVHSATWITVRVPKGTGTVNVRVTTAAGTSAKLSADRYTYKVPAPRVTGLNPTAGPTLGGATVTISGSGFSGASAVTFGATAASSFSVSSAGKIVATAPAGTGTVDVTVTTPAGTSATSAADQYSYYILAAVTGLSPTSGPAVGGTKVTITGSVLYAASAVTFGTTSAVFKAISNSKIVATAPPGTGTVDVRVTTPAGTSAAVTAAKYTYVAAPAVTGLSPTTGSTLGGTKVTITGSVFGGASAVKFGTSAAASFSVSSASEIVATAPAGTGTVDVRVTTPAGTSAVVTADRYTYVAPLITVTGVSSIADVPVAYGTSLGAAEAALPTTVGITLSDATSPTVDVTWAQGSPPYDGSTAGSYAFVGTLTNLPVGVTNPSGKTAAVNVNVAAPLLITVTGVNSIADVPVAYGTSLSAAEAALPTTVGITLSDATSPTVDVTWAQGSPPYDGSSAGSYAFVGTLTNLPAGVTNPSGLTAAVNVNVAASSDTAIASTLGNVDNSALTITAVPSDTTAGALKAGLSATDGSLQTYAVFESDGTTVVSDDSALTSDDLLVVTAANGSATASYTITVT